MKKNKEEKEISTFRKLWSNPQSRAGIKLLLYIIFIAGVCIFISVNKNIVNEIEQSNNQPLTFGDMQNKLINSNYHYNYEVMVNNNKIIYEGKKIDNVNTGYKKTVDKVVEYYIDNTGIYSVSLGVKTLDATIFEGIKIDYFDLTKLFKIIELISPLIEHHEEVTSYTYNINTTEEVSSIKIDTNQTGIESIEIHTLNNEYIMNFDTIVK